MKYSLHLAAGASVADRTKKDRNAVKRAKSKSGRYGGKGRPSLRQCTRRYGQPLTPVDLSFFGPKLTVVVYNNSSNCQA